MLSISNGIFSFYFDKRGSIPTLHLKTFNIFFSDPDFWKIYQNVGLAAWKWHGGSPTFPHFFLKSARRKFWRYYSTEVRDFRSRTDTWNNITAAIISFLGVCDRKSLMPWCFKISKSMLFESRDKGACFNISKSRDLCSKITASVIFFHEGREMKTWVRSRSKNTNRCFFSTTVVRYKITRRFRDLISREFSPCGSEKKMLKTFTCISLAHAGSYGGAPSVMSISSSKNSR